MENNLENFAKEFFGSLNATVTKKGNTLHITNIPLPFQKFYGKNEPYNIVFAKEDESDNTELLMKGSYLLKAMTAFLDNRGQTTLIKLKFEDNPRETLGNNISFDNTDISHITSKKDNKQFVRFTFQTVFKFLNDKETVVTEVYADENGFLDFDPKKYESEEGKKRDVTTENIKELYTKSREHTKVLLQDKIKEVSENLTNTLKNEIKRVRGHYDQQIKEIDDKLAKDLATLRELENTNKDVKDKDKKIERLKEQIRNYQKDNKRESLLKEADFFEQTEIKKHGLSMDTKLLNTTIFYYPEYNYGTFLKSGKTERLISFTFNPMMNTFSEIGCDVCGDKITTITLDNGGHIVCSKCQSTCEECQMPSCKSCLRHTCANTQKKICNNCAGRCQKCAKTKCLKYLHEHPHTKIKRCRECWKQCLKCQMLIDESELRGSVCQTCSRREVGASVRKNILNRDDW